MQRSRLPHWPDQARHDTYPIAKHPDYGEASFDITLNGLLERKHALSRDMLIPPVGAADVGALFSAAIQADGSGVQG